MSPQRAARSGRGGPEGDPTMTSDLAREKGLGGEGLPHTGIDRCRLAQRGGVSILGFFSSSFWVATVGGLRIRP